MNAASGYPEPHSVKGGVLADFLNGQHLTHLDVWRRHGSSRLAHHVLMLRKAGWPVQTELIGAETSQGRSACIARYWLPQASIDAAGPKGRDFIAAVESARRR